MSKKVRRLFEQFQPSSYEISLHPDKDNMSFSGSVTINGRKTGRPSQRITFHQKNLKVTEATLTKHDKNGDQTIKITRINSQKTLDEIRLHTEDLIYPGDYTVSLRFEGAITKAMHGLYPCYFNHGNQKKVLLATQFESHYAREVFPCIDEPEAKATFDLTLTAPSNETVLSNTPLTREEKLANDLKKVTFETTPRMSTYLLAFAIGEIHCVKSKTNDGVEMSTWATIAQPKEFLQYANDEAVKILEFFTDYYQTPFPLKKCDQIALPDFEMGAMENWGLVTYREVALLADPNNRSQSSEQYVSMVIAHELSHQWFGNLVTMKWWDNLWLNESFASMTEHIALNALHPDWFQWEQYTASDVLICSSRDIFKDVQSVQTDVNHPDEISTLFDPAIVYAKGGRLLKMMREYIGDEAFRQALKAYFKKHAYENTTGDDLWQEMSLASDKDIKAFMDPWLIQSGMPILEVNHTKNEISFSQKRFVLDKDDDSSLWPIPLLASQNLPIDILQKATANVPFSSNTPVIFNQYGSGHMLVHYLDEKTQAYIADNIGQKILGPESRINILNDLLLLSRKGEAPLSDGLDVVRECAGEDREAVWPVMLRILGTAVNLTEGDEATEKSIKLFRQKLASEWYKKLGWDDHPNDTPNTKGLRQVILSVMAGSDNEEAIQEAMRRYTEAGNAEKLPSEQRAMILATLVRKGEAVVDELIEEYKTSPNPDLQTSICAGLTNTEDEETAKYIIEKALGENGFARPQDVFRWYAYLMRNRHSRRATWNWLRDSWGRLEKVFGDSKRLEDFVVYAAGPLNTPEWQKEFSDFFTPMLDEISLNRNIKIALSEIEARVAWRQREEEKLKKYFSDYAKSVR